MRALKMKHLADEMLSLLMPFFNRNVTLKYMPRQKTDGTFASLQEEHSLWSVLEEKPQWWTNILNDPELYVEVRKDNYVNVYYYGGCIALIRWVNGKIMAETNLKYLAENNQTRKTSRNTNYSDCGELLQSREGLEEIKNRITQVYHKLPIQGEINNRKKVHISNEKMVQGRLILHNRDRYIDSELAYRTKGQETMRIDLVELRNQTLVIVELKLITDNRLRHLDGTAEIIDQMQKYHDFINHGNRLEELRSYYTKLLEIKKRIGVWGKEAKIKEVSRIPELLVIDTYSQMTKGRSNRIADIRKGLEAESSFEYSIQKYQDLCK